MVEMFFVIERVVRKIMISFAMYVTWKLVTCYLLPV